jgi:hypothetical protein
MDFSNAHSENVSATPTESLEREKQEAKKLVVSSKSKQTQKVFNYKEQKRQTFDTKPKPKPSHRLSTSNSK